jgi:threonine aldolase
VHLDGVRFDAPPQVNSVFPVLPPEVIVPLQRWCSFYDWDVSRHQVRWMAAWDTTATDVDQFVAGVAAALAAR